MFLNAADRLCDLIHVSSIAEQHVLCEPDRFRTKPIIFWTLQICFKKIGYPLFAVDGFVPPRAERVLKKWLAVERRIAARRRDPFSGHRFQESAARQAAE